MKILIISPFLPLPLRDGGRKGIYYPIKYLSEMGYEIHLVCLNETSPDDDINEIKKYAKLLIIKHSKTRTIYGLVKSVFNKYPYTLSRFHNQILLDEILKLINQNFDLVIIEGLHMAYYGIKIKAVSNIPIVLRLHNAESLIVKRFIKSCKNPLIRLYASLEYYKMQKYEKNEINFFEKVIFVTKDDEHLIKSLNPKLNTTVIPAGVDPNYFEYNNQFIENNSILWIGALDWLPNQDSFWWFYKDIVPKLISKNPSIKIYIIGSNPPPTIAKLKHPNMEILGYVDDVRPFFKKAKVCVVPLRIGGGIRIKILEMLAMKKAIVSTSIGCEGIGVSHYKELLIADEPELFSEYVIELLKNDELNKKISNSGYEFVLRNYQWSEIAKKFDNLYKSIVKRNL